jgi:hypothetical protein
MAGLRGRAAGPGCGGAERYTGFGPSKRAMRSAATDEAADVAADVEQADLRAWYATLGGVG